MNVDIEEQVVRKDGLCKAKGKKGVIVEMTAD